MARKKKIVGKINAAGKVVRLPPMQLIDIRVVESFAKQSIKEGPLPTVSEIQTQLEVGRHVKDPSALFVRPKIVFSVKYEKKQVEPNIIVSAQFQLCYKLVEGTNKDVTTEQKVAIGNGGMWHAWPFFRELFHAQMSRMGLPPLVLPLLVMPSRVGPIKRVGKPK